MTPLVRAGIFLAGSLLCVFAVSKKDKTVETKVDENEQIAKEKRTTASGARPSDGNQFGTGAEASGTLGNTGLGALGLPIREPELHTGAGAENSTETES